MSPAKSRNYPTPQYISETERAAEMGFSLEELSNANSLRFYREYLASGDRKDVSINSRKRLLKMGLIRNTRSQGKALFEITPAGEQLLAATRTRRRREPSDK